MTLREAPRRLVLLGHPVAHSRSPRMHNAALATAGISARYEALDVEPDRFDQTVAALVRERAAGNVTVPYKARMRDACEVLTPLAERVGAVNCWWIDERGRLTGDNTDVGGFDAAVAQLLGMRPRGLSVGLLGAGGAAAGVLGAVESWPGCLAHVYNRTPERARLLCERFRSAARPVDDVGVIAGCQLVVNATPVGLHDDSLPIEVSLLAPESVVVDLVYRPNETAFVRAARALGHRSVDGRAMLVEQGALAFERWFGSSPDRAVMWRAVAED
ncbi:MAG: shikimate dehydrogenase family protein [Gemmatimonadales bacterium]